MSIETFTVTTTGKGTPDYKRDIYYAATSADYKLQYGESFKNFGIVLNSLGSGSLFSFVTTPLAVSTPVSLMDLSTGITMPYGIPTGYGMKLLSDFWSFNLDAETRSYILGYFYAGAYPSARGTYYYNVIGGFDSASLDPTGALGVSVENVLYNPSTTLQLSGMWFETWVLRSLSTPPLPETKKVRCKWCGHEEVIKRTESKLVCPACKQTTLYFSESLPAVKLTSTLRNS